jgi:hypothetical protein
MAILTSFAWIKQLGPDRDPFTTRTMRARRCTQSQLLEFVRGET